MLIISASLILGVLVGAAIITHGFINHRAMLEMQMRQQDSQYTIQQRQQVHEMEFAAQQAKMFRENVQRQEPKKDKTVVC